MEYVNYKKMAAARMFFEEYRNMARLVDDLDTRFWKRFVMKDYRRKDSVDNAVSETALRKQYQNCVSDLVKLRSEVEEALASVRDRLCHDLMKDYFIRDMSYDEIADKWEMKSYEAARKIQEGLLMAKLPEGYKKWEDKDRHVAGIALMLEFERQ